MKWSCKTHTSRQANIVTSSLDATDWCCIQQLPYSGKLSGEQTFVNCVVLWLFANPQKFGVWRLLAQQKQAIREVFSTKIIFFTNSQKFSPSKVFHYTVDAKSEGSTLFRILWAQDCGDPSATKVSESFSKSTGPVRQSVESKSMKLYLPLNLFLLSPITIIQVTVNYFCGHSVVSILERPHVDLYDLETTVWPMRLQTVLPSYYALMHAFCSPDRLLFTFQWDVTSVLQHRQHTLVVMANEKPDKLSPEVLCPFMAVMYVRYVASGVNVRIRVVFQFK